MTFSYPHRGRHTAQRVHSSGPPPPPTNDRSSSASTRPAICAAWAVICPA